MVIHMKRYLPYLVTLTLPTVLFLAAACTTDKDMSSIRQHMINLEDRLNRLEEVRIQQANLGADLESINSRLATLENRLDEFQRQPTVSPDQASYGPPPRNAHDYTHPSTATLNYTPSTALATGPDNYPQLNSSGDYSATGATPTPAHDQTKTPNPVYGQPDTPILDLRHPAYSEKQIKEQSPDIDRDPAMTLYNEAHVQFKLRNYETAQALWSQFAQNYKKHPLLPTALFWQGECYYQTTDYNRAILAYQEVIGKYPKSSKYPAALLKQGMSFAVIGKKQAGTLVLQEVIKKYPNTPEAKRAQDFLKNPHL
ncbi:Cell division coordinator CpoB [Desulfovibrionales bacterium]